MDEALFEVSEPEPLISLEGLHKLLSRHLDALARVATPGPWPTGISSDTLFALGQLTGLTSKTKALTARDIDQRRAK